MDDQTLIVQIDYLTEEECHELVKEIMKTMKEKRCGTYQIKFGTSIGGGFEES